MSSLTDRKHELDTLIDGFLIPIFQREDPATGRMLNGLSRDDYQRVVAGYACPDCLARYKTYMATCPVCGWQRNINQDIQDAPGYWTQHLQDRADPDYGLRLPTQDAIEQALKDIHADKDVEQIPLSKLMPRRRAKKD